MQQDLNFYANLQITNPEDIAIPASIVNSRSSAVLDNPGDYECSIVRFQIDVTSIPMLYPFTPDPARPLETNFGLCFTYLGNVYPAAVTVTPYQKANGIFTYTEWCERINLAFGVAYAQLNADFPGFCTDQPNVFVDFNTNLLKMYAQQQYKDDYVGGPVGIWFNIDLQRQLNLPWSIYNLSAPQYRQYLIQVNNTGVAIPPNGLRYGFPETVNKMLGDVFQFTAEYNNLNYWISLNKIVFKTYQIPIVPEAVQTGKSIVGDPLSQDNSSPVFTDFVLDKGQAGSVLRGVYTYLPTAEYRMVALSPGSPSLNVLDVQAFWIDDYGFERPVILWKNGTMSLKILFRPREFRR